MRFLYVTLLTVLCLLLSGCLLVSGERSSTDRESGSGNLSASFVSAEGVELRTLQVADGPADVQVIAIVEVESGDLQLDVFDARGSLAFSVASKPASQITRSGVVPADAQGQISYRISARSARYGSYQLLFQQE